MSIPSLPAFYDMIYSQSDGRLTAEGYLYNDQMFQSLNVAIFLLNSIVTSSFSVNGTVTNDGLKAPSKTTVEITALEPDAEVGTIWFNTNLAKLQVKTAAGTVETITSA